MISPIQTVYFSQTTRGYQEHFHDCHEVLLIVRGTAEVFVNDVKYEAKGGDILLFSRYENHSVKPLSPKYERYVLRLNPLSSGNSRLFSILTNRPEGFCHKVDVSREKSLFCDRFARLAAEWEKEDLYRAHMLSLLTEEVLLSIRRRMPLQSEPDEGEEVMWEIQRHFETNFGEKYTLKGLAKKYHMSTSALSHGFKRITGKAVMDYLISCRIAWAKSALVNTDLSIGEIVEKSGFSDGSNFSRTFKKLTGLSPSAFREKEGKI